MFVAGKTKECDPLEISKMLFHVGENFCRFSPPQKSFLPTFREEFLS
jgi:hypothetical protein